MKKKTNPTTTSLQIDMHRDQFDKSCVNYSLRTMRTLRRAVRRIEISKYYEPKETMILKIVISPR